MRLMGFDFNIEYVKGNSVPHMNALSRLRFCKDPKENIKETFENTVLHWVGTRG